jgi:hypothetical protein
MRRLVVLPLVLLAAAAPAGAARAAFPAPVELAHGELLGATAATDPAGDTTVIATGADGGPRLLERAAGAAAFGPAVRLPGRALGGAKGPVVAAAGEGAAVAGWRNDRPRRYQSIVAMVRDPGGAAWSDPVTVSGAGENGVRHPAVAVDGAGRAVLAYNSDTRASHLSMWGGVTVVLRGAGAGFGEPVVVEDVPRAYAPAVAVGPDGRGIVAWVRSRRVWAVDVDAGAGTVGRVKALSPVGSWSLLHVAAGPGAAATVVVRGRVRGELALLAVRRPAAGTFSGRAFQVLGRFTRSSETTLQDFALAADATGRTTVVWNPQRYGGRAFTGGIAYASAAGDGASFSAPHELVPDDGPNCTLPSVAATAGRAAIGWTCIDRKSYTFQTALVDGANVAGPITTITTGPALPRYYEARLTILTGLDSTGLTTLTITRPDPLQPNTPITTRLLTTTGR